MHTYKEFLQEKIITDQKTVGYFKEENHQLFIVSNDICVPFSCVYKPQLHEALLIAAKHTLEMELGE